MLAANDVTTEHDPGLAQAPYDEHQHEHLTPHDDDGGPAFDGTNENGSGRGTTGSGTMKTTRGDNREGTGACGR